jgi:CRISPR-associated protein Cas5t
MPSIKTLRISISLPNAHFRVIHSNNPSKTYPVPPYSTVIGFLSNILGDKDSIKKMIEETFALGILAKYKHLTCEYTWLRNLSGNSHRSRFFSNTNRKWQGLPEHPGGQSPVIVEVLNQVEVHIYLHHSNPLILQKLQQNITAAEKWFSHLHLGRSEDWVIIESISQIDLSVSNTAKELREARTYYQWVPDPKYTFGINAGICPKEYTELYNKVQGNAVLVTSIYRLVEIPYGDSEFRLIRNFSHVPARLCCCSIPFLTNFRLPNLFTDTQLSTPVYMALINSEKGVCD